MRSVASTRYLFDTIAVKLGVQNQADWYKITGEDVRKHGGETVLKKLYNNFIGNALKDAYPEYLWHPWCFSKSHQKFWSVEMQKSYFKWLEEEFNIEKQEDWYGMLRGDIERTGRLSLALSSQNHATMLELLFPEFTWHIWKFVRVPSNYWKDISNRRKFFDWIAEEMDISTQQELYSLTSEDILRRKGANLLRWYHKKSLSTSGSYTLAVVDTYPEFTWHLWKFARVPTQFWNEKENQRKYLDWLAEELQIDSVEEWKYVSEEAVVNRHGISLLNCYNGSFRKALEAVYSEYDWSVASMSEGQSHAIQLLQKALQLKDEDIVVNDKIYWHSQNKTMELDIHIPSLCIALEYQGMQHYQRTYRGLIQDQRVRDEDKKKMCSELGISLIEIPYWWDSNINSLITSIAKSAKRHSHSQSQSQPQSQSQSYSSVSMTAEPKCYLN